MPTLTADQRQNLTDRMAEAHAAYGPAIAKMPDELAVLILSVFHMALDEGEDIPDCVEAAAGAAGLKAIIDTGDEWVANQVVKIARAYLALFLAEHTLEIANTEAEVVAEAERITTEAG